MNYLFCFMLLSSNFLCSMERELTVLHGDDVESRRENTPTIRSEVSDESVVFDAALQLYEKHRKPSTPCIKRYLTEVLDSEKNSPLVDLRHISLNISRIRSGDFPNDDSAGMEYMYEVLVKASQKALEDQQASLEHQRLQIERRWTKRRSLILTIVSSLVTAGVTFAASFTTKK